MLTVSGDVYRPAAIEQFKTVTAQAGAEWFPSTPDQKPVDIALAALDYARKHFFDVLLVDTAGRLAIDEALMREIRELHAALNPVETLFVVDAMQGQDAVNTAKAFKEALPLTGIILTKTRRRFTRRRGAVGARQVTGAPIKFAGTSEKLDGLEVFDAERHAGRMLGMGDIVALVEQVTAGVDMAAAQKLAAKVKSGGGFDLNDFLAQIQQMKQMGGLSSLMDKLPATMAAKAGQMDMDRVEKDIRRKEGIIHSMTPAGAAQARAHQGHAQAPHRRRRRRAGAGRQPPAQGVRADAGHDEEDEGRRHDENDEAHGRHERACRRCPSSFQRSGDDSNRAQPSLRAALCCCFAQLYRSMNDLAPTKRPAPPRHRGRRLRWCASGWLLFVLLSASGCAWLDDRERQLTRSPHAGRCARAGSRVRAMNAISSNCRPPLRSLAEATDTMAQRVEMWWLPNADPSAPTLLYFHGTVNNLAQNLSKMEALRAAGFAVLAVDYRGWGLSTPMTPSERSILQDADVAWAELERREPRAGRRVIYGHSMGSGVAVDLASRHRAPTDYAALILESAFTSFDGVAQDAGWWGRLLASLNHEHFASVEKIRQVHAPLLMLHGSADDTVPLRLGLQLYAAAHRPKRWVPIDGGGHADLQQIAPAQYQSALRSFREQYVAGPKPAAIPESGPPRHAASADTPG